MRCAELNGLWWLPDRLVRRFLRTIGVDTEPNFCIHRDRFTGLMLQTMLSSPCPQFLVLVVPSPLSFWCLLLVHVLVFSARFLWCLLLKPRSLQSQVLVLVLVGPVFAVFNPHPCGSSPCGIQSSSSSLWCSVLLTLEDLSGVCPRSLWFPVLVLITAG